MNLAQNLIRGRTFFPDRAAILFEGRSITYRELDESSNRLANALGGLGIERGDRVAIYLPNTPEFAVVYYGILKAGAIAVSINSIFKQQEVAFILAFAVVFATDRIQREFAEYESTSLASLTERPALKSRRPA